MKFHNAIIIAYLIDNVIIVPMRNEYNTENFIARSEYI